MTGAELEAAAETAWVAFLASEHPVRLRGALGPTVPPGTKKAFIAGYVAGFTDGGQFVRNRIEGALSR